jgi:serine protease inhibitor
LYSLKVSLNNWSSGKIINVAEKRNHFFTEYIITQNTHRMKTIYLYSLCLLLVSISCSKENKIVDPGPQDVVDIDLPVKGAEVVEASNTFGFDIFRAILADEPQGKNVFISPTSISLALGMTLNGANNATGDSMAHALRVDELTPEEINSTYSDLMNGLTTVDDKVLLSIANSIWYRLGFSVEASFLDINTTYYNAEIAELDFDSPDAVETINNWVSDNTNDRIPEIIDQIDPSTVMFLINAIYFKGIWKTEFNPESTYDGNFYLNDGTIKTVRTMALEEEIGYFENGIFQACELDYGQGNYSMVILLPKERASIEAITEQFNSDTWDEWMHSFEKDTVKLSLPKFTFDYEKKLNDILSLMGMGIAFDPSLADFTGINPEGNLFISFVKHKTFVEVNEEGTEAAAVTIVGIDVTAYPGDETVHMYVDRPFIFAIREKTTNAIVFMGKVAEPVAEE